MIGHLQHTAEQHLSKAVKTQCHRRLNCIAQKHQCRSADLEGTLKEGIVVMLSAIPLGRARTLAPLLRPPTLPYTAHFSISPHM